MLIALLTSTPKDLSVLTAPEMVYAAAPVVVPDLQTLASTTAQMYGLDVNRFVATIKCESDFDPGAIGDDGTSYGIAQIHLPAHPDISVQEALDPVYALEWAATEWKAGKMDEWTCYSETT